MNMETENLWLSGNCDVHLKYTDNIYKIIRQQCDYLEQNTNGKVFGVFGEIKKESSLIPIISDASEMIKNSSFKNAMDETVDGYSISTRIDAGDMYYEKEYGFEICTDTYRFRVFEIRMKPVFPIEMIVDEDVSRDLLKKGISVENIKNNHYIIQDEEEFYQVFKHIIQDTKVQFIVAKFCQDPTKFDTGRVSAKIIICEGRIDELIIRGVANKLEKDVSTIVTYGSASIPTIIKRFDNRTDFSNIMVIVDSDLDQKTIKALKENSERLRYRFIIVENRIEDWFSINYTGYDKLKLIKEIASIVDKSDFEEISRKYASFKELVMFILS